MRGPVSRQDCPELSADTSAVNDGEAGGDPGVQDGEGDGDAGTEDEEDRPLSDILVRDLTAHRTLGLRLNLSEQPDVAIMALTHALSAQVFYVGADVHVVGIQPVKTGLAAHAVGIEDTPAGKAWADRHANWARQMPREVTALWAFVAELDHDGRLALLAHCIALTVNVVRLPWEKKPRGLVKADRLAEAVALDMTGYWRPTARSYLGRVTKARILDAVREGVSAEAAGAAKGALRGAAARLY
jgi:ParB family transcriptional regulator, chromosome partitioning protein